MKETIQVSAPKAPGLAVVPAGKGNASAEKTSVEKASAEGVQILQPSGWPAPKGYTNDMAADGRLVVTGGVIGWDGEGRLAGDFVAQVGQTLSNISAILAEGGAPNVWCS
jgi:enamine deaminase RidA (YjgF/YER057c/UK114 family)